jgi:hypothetical protein
MLNRARKYSLSSAYYADLKILLQKSEKIGSTIFRKNKIQTLSEKDYFEIACEETHSKNFPIGVCLSSLSSISNVT